MRTSQKYLHLLTLILDLLFQAPPIPAICASSDNNFHHSMECEGSVESPQHWLNLGLCISWPAVVQSVGLSLCAETSQFLHFLLSTFYEQRRIIHII
jgi:hypothetical protein